MCQFIPDKLLKQLGDKHSMQVSRNLRYSRSRLLRPFKSKPTLGEVPNTEAYRYTYDCNHTSELPGTLIEIEGSASGSQDIQIYDAHRFAKVVRDFYKEVLGRNSWDGKGMDLVSSCHFSQNYNNAFFNGSQMVYGDGDNKFFTYLAKDLSVIGHEFSHGVVQATADLVYAGQSGAANESYADKFGIAIEHWYTQQNNPNTAGWLIGDEIIGSEFPGKALRSFKNEKSYDWDDQPKHMHNYKKGYEDNGEVHNNSGILNHAFYLYSLKINVPSYDKPIKIAYQALQSLKQNSNFRDVRDAEIRAAKELYGKVAARCVTEAYQEVGL